MISLIFVLIYLIKLNSFFQLKYWKQENREEDAVYYLSRSTRPWAVIVGLQPDTYYFVKVMAYNSAGEGPESERYLGNYLNNLTFELYFFFFFKTNQRGCALIDANKYTHK